MEEDPRIAYLTLYGKLEEAEAKVDRAQQLIAKVAGSLSDPTRCLRIEGRSYPINIPRGVQIHSRDWPSAEALSDITVEYWELRVKANRAWSRLSQAQKGGLTPPPPIS